MKRKLLTGIILLIAIPTVAVCVVLSINFLGDPFRYEKTKTITRNTDNSEEAQALSTAENVEYADIFNTSRFMSANLSDYSTDAYANVVDAEVIEYFDKRFESLKEKPKPRGITLNYTASVTAWEEAHAVFIPPPENETIYSARVLIQGSNDTILNEVRGGNGRYAYRNDSEIQEIQETTIDFSFSNCFVVEMEFGYSEVTGSLGAYFFHIYQTVIIDSNLNPVFIRLSGYEGVS